MDERMERARELRAAGQTLAEIAEVFGVSAPTVHRWTAPGALERSRQTSRAWKAANADRNREKDREYKNSAFARGVCETCGGSMSMAGRWRFKRCQSCIAAEADHRRDLVERLWNSGLSFPEVVERSGMPRGTVASVLYDLRRLGRVPYRYAACAAKADSDAMFATHRPKS